MRALPAAALSTVLPEPPDLEESTDLTPISADSIIDQCMHEHVQLKGEPAGAVDARGVALSSSRVTARVLMGSTLPGFRCVDCVFDRADCSNANWVDARLVRARFDSCKLTGLDTRGGALRDVTFNACKMPDAFMPESNLERVVFQSCQLSGLDLTGAKLSRVTMRDCDARNIRLSGAHIEKLDLRASRIEGIAIDARSIAQIIIDPLQAPALAHAMGARVLDLNEPL